MVSINYGGAEGEIKLTLNKDILEDEAVHNTRFATSLREVTSGTPDIPAPIKVTVIPISEAFNDVLWAEDEWASIREKRTSLTKALKDYPTIKGAQIASGMQI